MVLHTCSCRLCRRREDATSPQQSGQWCHSWEYSTHTETHTQLIDMLLSLTHFLPLPPLPHQKLDSPVCCNISTHYHLVASLPLEEEQFGGSVWQAGLVVPHQVPTHKPTVVPRMQSGIQQEGVIL